MILGKGYAKIGLYDNDETLHDFSEDPPNPYTLDNSIQTALVQMQQPYVIDGARIELDNGKYREIIRGKRVSIQIPVRVVEDVTDSDWETFLYQLYDWPGTGIIKVTPYVDKPTLAYWVLFEHGRRANRDLFDIRETDTLEFTGYEIIDSIS